MTGPHAHTDGREMARRYYSEVVAPLLLSRWPGLPHAAGRLGTGSDVLGLDDLMSRDHDWGLRLTIMVSAEMRDNVHELLAQELPEVFDGLPTRLMLTGHSDAVLGVDVETASSFTRSRLGLDPREELGPLDWLTLTGQAVLEVVAGPIFHDSTGDITDIRKRLEWYPDDVWKYVIACDWARLSEEMPVMSRAGDQGDHLGSQVIAARLIDIAMHLGFLLERQWPPYSKWRGILFSRIPAMEPVSGHLLATLRAETWQVRQACLAAALDELLSVQRTLGLPASPPTATAPFHDRPSVAPDERVVEDLLGAISDPCLSKLPRGRGSIEQQTDNVALLVDAGARRGAATLDKSAR